MFTGIDANNAAAMLGPEYTAKSTRYLEDYKGCHLCLSKDIIASFSTWDKLVNYINKELELRGRCVYERPDYGEETRRTKQFRLPLHPSVPEL